MRIALDAMGGDNAPQEIIEGAIESIEYLDQDDRVILVGPESLIQERLSSVKQHTRESIEIVHATENIGMDESPVESLRKKPKSSIAVLAKLAKHGEVDAVISAGNTGACVAAFQMRMRNLQGVNRPGIAIVMPTALGPVTICDVGANISCKPMNLYQYGIMASVYSQHALGIENPRIGIMSIGEEDVKGNEIIKKARELIKSNASLKFIGNIEGRDIFKGVCDVVVCDGFVGNVVLKVSEGLVDGIFQAIKDEVKSEKNILLAHTFKGVLKRFYKKYDYHEYGGAPLLGINGTAMICHGSSHKRSIRNAILTAKRYCTHRINEIIVEALSNGPEEPTVTHAQVG